MVQLPLDTGDAVVDHWSKFNFAFECQLCQKSLYHSIDELATIIRVENSWHTEVGEELVIECSTHIDSMLALKWIGQVEFWRSTGRHNAVSSGIYHLEDGALSMRSIYLGYTKSL